MLNVLTEKQVEESISRPVGNSTEVSRMRVWLEERIARGKKNPIAEVVTLTPVLASLLLDRNSANRPISKTGKNEIKQDIANGRFVFNGESIIVSDTGILNDGQHRCINVLETGIPIQTVIVFGPKEETRFSVDSGKSKTVSNYLAMKGRKYTHILGAAVSFIVQWKSKGYLNHGNEYTRPSKQAILEASDQLRGIDGSVEFTAPAMKSVGSHAVLAFCHYAFWKASSRENADHFMTKLMEGDGLRKGDPILYCRNRLLGMGREAHAGVRAELVFKCWNAWRSGHTIDHFKMSGGKLPKLER
jgi:hypothetical protein